MVAARQEALSPGTHHDWVEEVLQTEQEKQHIHQSRELTDGFMAQHAITLYEKTPRCRRSLDKLQLQRQSLDRRLGEQEQQVATLQQQIPENGGSRPQQLQGEMLRLGQERDTARQHYLVCYYFKLISIISKTKVRTYCF